jgi:hypothetical protein
LWPTDRVSEPFRCDTHPWEISLPGCSSLTLRNLCGQERLDPAAELLRAVIRAGLAIVSVMADEQRPSLTRPGPAALTDVLPGPDGPLPLLILDERPEMAVHSGDAERVNPIVSVLLSLGLTLVTTISEAGPGTPDVIEVGEPLAPVPGWRLEVSARRAARLTARTGQPCTTGSAASPSRGAR